MHEHLQTLSAAERIKSKKLIDTLFTGGRSKSMTAFPLRAVYMEMNRETAATATPAAAIAPPASTAQILVSVPKRCFKHAVKRNRVKRQVREAYRRHKALLRQHAVAIAFIWLDARLHTSEEVERQVVSLMRRIGEKIDHKEPGDNTQPERSQS